MNDDLKQILDTYAQPIRLKKGHHVFRQGERDRSLYFVSRGLLKAYYISEDGKESIKSLIQEGGLIGSLTAAYGDERCSFSLLCLEPCHLAKLSFDEIFAAARKDIAIASVVIDLLVGLAMKKERREMEFLTLSAADRYALFTTRTPELEGRVTQKDIARYLGITPVALSRIRGRKEKSRIE